MKRNTGRFDRMIRITIATLLALLILSNQILETQAIFAGFVAVYLFITALYAYSPIYDYFKINSK